VREPSRRELEHHYATLAPRLRARISVSTAGCWLSVGRYTRIDGVLLSVRRVVWQHVKGERPTERLTTICGVSECVSPSHLVPYSSGRGRWQAKVPDSLIKVEKTSGCWLWTGSFSTKPRKPLLGRKINGHTSPARYFYEREQGNLNSKRLARACPDARCVAPAHHQLSSIDTGKNRSEGERFWSKVARSSDDDCWLWTGRTLKGYGSFQVGSKDRFEAAHRVAWRLIHGSPVPDGLVLDHLCSNRLCVNAVRHLEPVSFGENIARGHEAAAANLAPPPPVGPKVVLPEPYRSRFWSKVDKGTGNGCWLWTAGTSHKTYGTFSIGSGMRSAHRVAYEELVGQIPAGLVLDHLCRYTLCVRPTHLEPVYRQTNTARGWRAILEERQTDACRQLVTDPTRGNMKNVQERFRAGSSAPGSPGIPMGSR
jgi:hypothetical protein